VFATTQHRPRNNEKTPLCWCVSSQKVLTRLGSLRDAAVAALDYIDRTCDAFLEEDEFQQCSEAEGALATLLFRGGPSSTEDAAEDDDDDDVASRAVSASSSSSRQHQHAAASQQVAPTTTHSRNNKTQGTAAAAHPPTTGDAVLDSSTRRSHAERIIARTPQRQRPAAPVERDERAPTDLGDEEWVLIRDAPPNLAEWSVVSITAS